LLSSLSVPSGSSEDDFLRAAFMMLAILCQLDLVLPALPARSGRARIASQGSILNKRGLCPALFRAQILFTVGPAKRSDPAQMTLRLIAVALLDLPQTVILPGRHMARICLQCALVPDLRELVIAELAIGITDQIGHIRAIVVAERLQLLDSGNISSRSQIVA
jgi:hypothetical protein